MRTYRTFSSQDKMKDLIKENNILLLVMSRFGIPLGFSDKDVSTVCNEFSVDCNTFLAICNFITFKKKTHPVSISQLIRYLKNTHRFFREYSLPSMRRKLIEALDCCSEFNDITISIIRFYDDYALEVKRHMEYEDNTVFAYVGNLLEGKLSNRYCIDSFKGKHNHIDEKLKELKEILIRYYPHEENNLLNSALLDMMMCEDDLISHCMVEDEIFMVEATLLENAVKSTSSVVMTDDKDDAQEEEEPDKASILSDREKDIVKCIAKGMSNKDIAKHLFLSIYTINTHRRNICNKLNIHSSAGLTIFAIINKLVKLDEIKQIK